MRNLLEETIRENKLQKLAQTEDLLNLLYKQRKINASEHDRRYLKAYKELEL